MLPLILPISAVLIGVALLLLAWVRTLLIWAACR